MTQRSQQSIGILYEHPEWFNLLFAELERREIPFQKLYVDEHRFDPAIRQAPYSLVVNRVSPSSYTRGHAGSILYARQYLAYLREVGVPVINGYDAYTLETSKALQLLLFERLGVRYPLARVVNHHSQLPAAAEGLRYPLIVKPNIGGSGALMQRFESPAALDAAARAGGIDFGVDHTALVQEYLAPAEGCIVRVEVLDGAYLYAIRIFTNPEEGFNLCPADICRTDLPAAEGEACDYGAGAVANPAGDSIVSPMVTPVVSPIVSPPPVTKRPLRIEPYTPPRQVVEDAVRLVKAGGVDVGGVEYLVAERDGLPYFYDVNALSNFVTDAPTLLGFDPTARFVDFIAQRAGIRSLVTA